MTFARATARVTKPHRSRSLRDDLHRADRHSANRHTGVHQARIRRDKRCNAEHRPYRTCRTYNTFLEAEPNLRVDASIVSSGPGAKTAKAARSRSRLPKQSRTQVTRAPPKYRVVKKFQKLQRKRQPVATPGTPPPPKPPPPRPPKPPARPPPWPPPPWTPRPPPPRHAAAHHRFALTI